MKRIIACCWGTRPEFIKMAPAVLELKKRKFVYTVLVCSGQHQELLRGIGEDFGVKPDIELGVRKKIGDTSDLSELAAGLTVGFSKEFARIRPDAVMVQGDAASAAFAALAAFHRQLPIYYIEAGLRTHDLSQPFPEEGYRQMISRIAALLFCPTGIDGDNLIRERIPKEKIFVVGNTVVDALNTILVSKGPTPMSHRGRTLRDKNNKMIVVTLHRRENWGEPMKRILSALKKISARHPNCEFVVSVHPNPIVKTEVENALKNLGRFTPYHERPGRKSRDEWSKSPEGQNLKPWTSVHGTGFTLINPPSYRQFIELVSGSAGVITDSGGIQEESPTMGIPCLVVREKTERVAGIKTGWSLLAGTNEKNIISDFEWLINWKRPKGGNPYGDGKAAIRIADVIEKVWK